MDISQNDGRDALKLTFEEIKNILGFDIDHSFLNYKKQAIRYGYYIGKISLKEKHITFHKTDNTQSHVEQNLKH